MKTMRGRLSRALLVLLLAAANVTGCPSSRAPKSAVSLRSIAAGFTSPVGLVEPPDGSHRLFVVDQIGLIRVIDAGNNLASDPFLDLRDKLIQLSPTYDERGLLSMALHPNFATNGRFFVVYNAPPSASGDSDLVLSEFSASADLAAGNANSEQVLLRIAKPQPNHNGGQLAFGPDGFLYMSVGDGGGGNDQGTGHTPSIGNAQDRSNLLGKILRLDVDSASPYAIPPDNPFVNRADNRGEIWAYGLRNTWRFSFDMHGGRLIAGDVGQGLFEEVDIITKGSNFGWHIREGSSCFNMANAGQPLADCPATGLDGEPLISPIISYSHASSTDMPSGEAVIGGYVYRGSAVPSLAGEYVFGDFTTGGILPTGQIFAAHENSDGTWAPRILQIADRSNGSLGRYVLAFGQDSAGEIYVLVSGNAGPSGTTGEVLRLESPS